MEKSIKDYSLWYTGFYKMRPTTVLSPFWDSFYIFFPFGIIIFNWLNMGQFHQHIMNSFCLSRYMLLFWHSNKFWAYLVELNSILLMNPIVDSYTWNRFGEIGPTNIYIYVYFFFTVVENFFFSENIFCLEISYILFQSYHHPRAVIYFYLARAREQNGKV